MIRLAKSFYNAFRGIYTALGEHTFRILILVSVVMISLSFFFPLSLIEKALVFFIIGVVLALELINSQIERMLDMLRPDYSEEVRRIKDISAGAVLVVSIASAVAGAIIFIHYII